MFILDVDGEVRRALQTLSVALVVDEDTSTVRPHLYAPPTPAAASSDHGHTRRDRRGHLSFKQVKELRLAPAECEGIKNIGCKHLLLSHYRNQLLHWFVSEAMLALSLSLNGNHDTRVGKINDYKFYLSYVLYLNFFCLALLKFRALHIALSCELVLPLKHPDQVSKIVEDASFFLSRPNYTRVENVCSCSQTVFCGS